MGSPASRLAERFPPGALRPVAGFPGLRLLWHLRRCPGFSPRLLGTSVSGQPPAFTSVDSARPFRWRIFADLTALCGS
jgi:hypothetical protein